jgi:hypothetical protein
VSIPTDSIMVYQARAVPVLCVTAELSNEANRINLLCRRSGTLSCVSELATVEENNFQEI